MNFWNDQVLMSSICNEFCQPSHLALPFYDSYAFEGYNVVPEEVESQFDCSSFDSSKYQETRDQLSYYRKVNGELCSRSREKLVRNENETDPTSDWRPLNNIKEASQPNIVSKTRLKWTGELHQKFVDCVDELGGAQKATPKQLLHLMKIKGLTPIHIKSHLQKYRTSHQMHQFSKGKSERISKKEMVQPNQSIGKKLMETVRQQLETQISLDQQLKVQKNLILAIEEQIKQLREVLEPRRKPVPLRNDERSK